MDRNGPAARLFSGLILLLPVALAAACGPSQGTNPRPVAPTKLVISAQFARASSFSEGLAAVQFGEGGAGKWGFIDKSGRTVIAPKFDWAGDFSGGLAEVGTGDERAKSVMTDLYRPLYLNQAPILYTGRRTAELIKYASNAFLATKITFINEVADLCERVGADVQDVARGIGLDNRIGSKFLHAGPGYGGSCFPKDTVALIKTAQERVAGFLLEMAARVPVGNEIDLPMSRQDIADYLGLTIETVSRTLTQLENTAAIAVPTSRRIVLRNRAALNRLNA